jgi:hypothetical protein
VQLKYFEVSARVNLDDFGQVTRALMTTVASLTPVIPP